MTQTNKTEAYFAAANTYRGFVSYFDYIFRSEDFSRIYVLKGGPGTGKSSLMKSVAKELIQNSCKVEMIYCSSDPKSLDGIIVTNQNGKIAIIDGTAPHERDAKIPCAIDEIINLSDNLDAAFLISQKDKIIELNKEKSKAYSTSYFYLSIAGEAHKYISKIYSASFDIIRAKAKAELLLSNICEEKSGEMKERLISSFGRYGSYKLTAHEEGAEKKITVYGEEENRYLFLGCISTFLRDNRTNYTQFIRALDPEMTEGIYLPYSKTIFEESDAGDVDADEFSTLDSVDKERVRVARILLNDSTEEARRWFSIASDVHFRLEKIYSGAMNFEKNDEVIKNKLAEIKNILQI